MKNRRTILMTVIATALLAFCLPSLAVAQGRYDPYGRNRGYGRYDVRYLRDSVRRLKDLSGRFEDHLDSALDRSRVDGTRREDHLNDIAREFHNAAKDLEIALMTGRPNVRGERKGFLISADSLIVSFSGMMVAEV